MNKLIEEVKQDMDKEADERSKIQPTKIGDIVLFNIGHSHSGDDVLRPLLVTQSTGETVCGEVFLIPEVDEIHLWPRDTLFAKLHHGNRMVPVLNIQRGLEVGKWRSKG